MVTAPEVLRYLDAADFPAPRDEIVQEAEREGAPPEVLKALRGMPPVDYHNKDEVARSAKTDLIDLSDAERAARARDRKHERIAMPERPPD
ncbi:MAG: hypothetical protein JWN35_238 [Frankiales bacterium]|jgi:hypothetical protein|nr:hypothetical protein [Frankiales bacterium]